ncbi:unnamed protein product [Psylliodes chrysocephalus]|uniref:Uncharacterized protein n=1 Tax=Psylliodes chrysocephalus TaxID=3402493 RepID=A0A9P0D1E3_9CUCU|nr:unnamed protein product [Psylliodes chrysocephala]
MVTSTSAEAQLLPLMNVTVRRLSECLEEVLITLKEKERDCLTIISKWGCDGFQQSQFKQKLESDIESDSSIFQNCFGLLQLVSGDKNEKVLWNNLTPSQPRFCRPIRFRFIKETNNVTEEQNNTRQKRYYLFSSNRGRPRREKVVNHEQIYYDHGRWKGLQY